MAFFFYSALLLLSIVVFQFIRGWLRAGHIKRLRSLTHDTVVWLHKHSRDIGLLLGRSADEAAQFGGQILKSEVVLFARTSGGALHFSNLGIPLSVRAELDQSNTITRISLVGHGILEGTLFTKSGSKWQIHCTPPVYFGARPSKKQETASLVGPYLRYFMCLFPDYEDEETKPNRAKRAEVVDEVTRGLDKQMAEISILAGRLADAKSASIVRPTPIADFTKKTPRDQMGVDRSFRQS